MLHVNFIVILVRNLFILAVGKISFSRSNSHVTVTIVTDLRKEPRSDQRRDNESKMFVIEKPIFPIPSLFVSVVFHILFHSMFFKNLKSFIIFYACILLLIIYKQKNYFKGENLKTYFCYFIIIFRNYKF